MCPSTDEWIKMWHIYTMEYYSAIKINEIELFVVRWMDLESVIQSEASEKWTQHVQTAMAVKGGEQTDGPGPERELGCSQGRRVFVFRMTF